MTTLVNSTKGELSPELILKSSYVVDFLGLTKGFSESELEDAVVEQLERFIMELGQDFAFLERQKRKTGLSPWHLGFVGAVGDKEMKIEGNYRHTSNYPLTDHLY